MAQGFIYIRGFGASLFWSSNRNIRFWSRKELEPMDLSKISVTPTGTQAVVEAWRCSTCTFVTFRSS